MYSFVKKTFKNVVNYDIFRRYYFWIPATIALLIVPLITWVVITMAFSVEYNLGEFNTLEEVIKITAPIGLLSFFILLLFALDKWSIKGAYNKDLKYVGFTDFKAMADTSDADLSLTKWMNYSDLELEENPKVERSANRVRAFFSYGMYSFLRAGRTKLPLVEEDGGFIENHIPLQVTYKVLQILLWDSIQQSKRIMSRKRLKYPTNPIPLAAYLFWVATKDNNAKSKASQEKALLLWEKGASLSTTLKVRNHSLSQVGVMAELPGSWVDELSETYQDEWGNKFVPA